MKKVFQEKRKKIFLVLSVCVCWILPCIYSLFWSFQKQVIVQASIVIGTLIGATVCFYVFNNSIIHIFALVTSIVILTMGIGYRYTLNVLAVFVAIYIYISSVVKNNKTSNITDFLLTGVPLVSVVGIIVNLNQIKFDKEESAEIIVVLIAFIIVFLILIKGLGKEQIEKNNRILYKNLFYLSIFGVISLSTSSYVFANNSGLTFFPWFFFLTQLIYWEDVSLHTGTMLVMEKLKNFLK